MNFNNFKNIGFEINYEGHILINRNNVTFLGLIINSKFNSKEQIEKVVNKINRFSFALYKLSKVANRKTARTAYSAYVESVLRYGLLIWGNGSEIKKVFIAQKRCIRSICDIAPDVSCRPYFIDLKILPLVCLYILEVGKFVKQHPEVFRRAKDITRRENIRNPDRLVLNMVPRSSRMQNNSYAMCVKIYNHIPKEIKILPPNKFIAKLRWWLMQKNFYDLKEVFDNKCNDY